MFDWTKDDEVVAGLAVGLKAGKTPEQMARLVHLAMERNKAEEEEAKNLPLFPLMAPEQFEQHLAIIMDRGGIASAETCLKGLVMAVIAGDQIAYQKAVFQLVKTVRLNLPHLEQFTHGQLKAMADAKRLPEHLDGAFEAVAQYLKSTGELR